MSAEGQGDSLSLDKQEEASSSASEPGIPKDSSETEVSVSSPPKSSTLNTLTFMGEEIEPFDDDVEAVIEKKLHPLIKDKGPDVDSELDFELKWDDDSDNQSALKIDAKLDESLELDDDDALTDDPQKTKADNVALKAELKTIEDDNNDQLKVIDEIGEVSAKEAGNEAIQVEKSTEFVPNIEIEAPDIDETGKINPDSKISSEASENSSVDEPLVYSDVEVPEIEDKELLDEIDAQICDAEFNEEEKDMEDTTVSPKPSFVPERSEESDDVDSPKHITDSAIDVDEVSKSFDNKTDPNDTSSANNDLETSSYEINNDHRLTKPDVMLEIPTQELIESLDDSEMSDGALEYDEDVLLSNDAPNKDPDVIEDKDLAESSEIIEETPDKDEITDEKVILCDDDTTKTDTCVTDQDILENENIDEKMNVSDETSDIIVTDADEIETMDVDENGSHADIILDASHLAENPETDANSQLTDEATPIMEADVTSPTFTAPFDTEAVDDSSIDELQPVASMNVDNAIVAETELNITEIVSENLEDVKEKPCAVDMEPEEAVEVVNAEEITEDVMVAKEAITTMDETDKSDPVANIVISSEIVSTETTDQESVSTEVAKSDNLDTTENISVSENPQEATTSATDLPSIVNDDKKDTPIEENLEVTDDNLSKEVCDAELKDAKEVIDDSQTVEQPAEESPKEVTNEELEEVKDVNACKEKEASLEEQQPSTSKYMQESSDEDQEVTDSLGLLAESSRVMDDDDEPENEDDDDDDDFDQDDESNHMTAEHSEDSNAQHSETEVAKETMEAEESTEKELQFQIDDVVSGVSGIDDVTTETEVPENLEESMKVSEESEVEKAVQSLLEVGDDTTTEDVVDNVAEEVEDTTDYAVKSPLSKDLARDEETAGAASKLKELLSKDREGDETVEAEKTSPSKTRKLEIAKPKNEINIVELEESSSEDDIQEVLKPSEVTSVNIPEEVEVMSASAGNTSDMRQGEGEVVISGVPKPSPQKTTRLNTGELTIKTAAAVTESLVIPETAMPANAQQPKLGLEIFSLDSDEEDKEPAVPDEKPPPLEVAPARCSNPRCGVAAPPPGPRRGAVCRACDAALIDRRLGLIEGIKEYSPLLTLDMGQVREELVEISDSDSDEDTDAAKPVGDAIGEKEASFLEDQLASMFNNTWKKYNLDERLQAAVTEINLDVKNLEEECSKIDSMLNECQIATDKLRNDLYDTFSGEKNELPAVVIFDTPNSTWSGLEENIQVFDSKETRQSKRRSSVVEPPAKRPAIPLGYSPLEGDGNTANNSKVAASNTDVAVQNDDDNSDISVVKLSAESAPADLPGPGTPTRPPLRVQMPVYAMRNAFGSWSKARIIDVQPKVNQNQFTTCRVKFEHKVKNPTKVLQARCLAYEHPSDVRMTIGTRLIALFKDNDNKRESYYSGIVAEIPNPVNNYRYLVFFDDGYAQYVPHSATRLVCESAPLVWDEVHPFSRQFVREYLRSYPERPMVRVHAGQSIRTEYNGKWWDSKVLQVDASLVQVHFDKENRTEWIYRGSTRLAPLYWELQAAERPRARPLPRAQHRLGNVPYVEYTRSDETPPAPVPGPKQIEQDIRRQRAVAKKSTAAPPPPAAPQDAVASRVVFYTPKNAIRPHKMVPHTCGPRCKRTDVLALKDLRTYNPLTKPLLSGWERQIVKYKWSRSVMYRAPCGRRLRSYQELHRYLQITNSDMPVDLFDFGPNTHCLAEFVLTKCRISKKDLSHGKENVPVPCVNYYDDSLPEFCSYNTERTPTAGVPLNLDPEFLCGCDCTDDCADKSKCACWKMTLEGARTIGLDSEDVGYVYKRLPEPLPSGIYECNSRCKCRQTCLNRVAQHPLQLKLQVFKTLNRGWGIRALNDIPKGAFLCVYAGNLLTDATANLDGLNEGDEYLAELDYIEVVEQMKEGFEEDVPDADKKLDKESADQEDESSTTSSEEEEDPRKDADDDDFRPALPLAPSTTEFSKRLRKRDKKKKDDTKEKQKEKDKEPNSEDNCITISDDEELREPARFAAQAGMDGKGFVSKYKSVRAHFGKDEACYIMDAKVQGNIGRYLNHSCTPNVFVQNVFVDTHDPRFPWVAFFALSHIRAGTELTWNYNYDVGSVPGKVLYCHCAAPNCRGRLL